VDQPLGSRYLLHDLLGRGAMGHVYRASVRDSGVPVAVKILKPELVSDPDVVARFFQERSILTAISDPHVVRVIDLVVEGETIGIVMELVEGQDLRRVLLGGTLPPGQAVGLTCQLLEGLTAVHAAGIIHRDIKPENVLADAAGDQMRLKVTDFGVARLSYGASLTKLSSLIGTPEYMAPEVADHDTAAPATDLYSAGIVLYEMLCGRTPFAGGHPLAVLRRHVDQAPPPIPGVPPELWAQIEALLAKDPLARPESAAASAAALAALESSLAGLPALPPMAAPANVTVTPSRTVTNLGRQSRPPGRVTVPPGLDQYETVLRHRDPAGATAPDLPGSPPLPQSRPKRSVLRSRPVALAAAALVVLAVAAGVLLTRKGHPAAGSTPSRTASYAFAPQQYPDGLLIVRRWTLSGKHADGALHPVAHQDRASGSCRAMAATAAGSGHRHRRLPRGRQPGRGHHGPARQLGQGLHLTPGNPAHAERRHHPDPLAVHRTAHTADRHRQEYPATLDRPARQRQERATADPRRGRLDNREPGHRHCRLLRPGNRNQPRHHPRDRADRNGARVGDRGRHQLTGPHAGEQPVGNRREQPRQRPADLPRRDANPRTGSHHHQADTVSHHGDTVTDPVGHIAHPVGHVAHPVAHVARRLTHRVGRVAHRFDDVCHHTATPVPYQRRSA
jgi:serine/threonine protein kinase